MKKKERDFTARLTVYGLPSMTKKGGTRFVRWLRTLADDLEDDIVKDGSKYDGMFTAKLMK